MHLPLDNILYMVIGSGLGVMKKRPTMPSYLFMKSYSSEYREKKKFK
jgi:hypothetical protein